MPSVRAAECVLFVHAIVCACVRNSQVNNMRTSVCVQAAALGRAGNILQCAQNWRGGGGGSVCVFFYDTYAQHCAGHVTGRRPITRAHTEGTPFSGVITFWNITFDTPLVQHVLAGVQLPRVARVGLQMKCEICGMFDRYNVQSVCVCASLWVTNLPIAYIPCFHEHTRRRGRTHQGYRMCGFFVLFRLTKEKRSTVAVLLTLYAR